MDYLHLEMSYPASSVASHFPILCALLCCGNLVIADQICLCKWFSPIFTAECHCCINLLWSKPWKTNQSSTQNWGNWSIRNRSLLPLQGRLWGNTTAPACPEPRNSPSRSCTCISNSWNNLADSQYFVTDTLQELPGRKISVNPSSREEAETCLPVQPSLRSQDCSGWERPLGSGP